MGVTYKLKSEIIDFIVTQKKDIPNISCRKLADLVSEKFQIQVSKSSVNTILKNSQLSSPVGRRALGDKKVKKFILPEERKQILGKDLNKAGLKVDPVEPSATISLKNENAPPKKETLLPEPTAKPIIPERQNPPIFKQPPVVIEQEPLREELKPEEVPRLLPDPVGKPASRSVSPEEPVKAVASHEAGLAAQHMDDPGLLLDGMGCIFLKAAEWDLSSRPILGEVIRNQVNVRFLNQVSALSEALLFSEAFNIRALDDFRLYRGQGLWTLSGLRHSIDPEIIRNFVEGIENPKMLALRVSNEKMSVLSELCNFKFELQDKTEFFMDARLRTLWSYSISSALSAPLNKVITTLSRNLINNVHSAVFYTIPGEDTFGGAFYQLIAAFEGFPGKEIQKISVMDAQGEEVAKFTSIPSKRRIFISAAWPWQKEYQRLLEVDSQKIRYFHDPEFGTAVYYSEGMTTLDAVSGQGYPFPMRIVFLRNALKDSPILAVVTNAGFGDFSAEQIVQEYLRRWPDTHKGYVKFLQNSESSDDILRKLGEKAPEAYFLGVPGESGWEILRSVFKSLLFDLHGYCQRHFFPAEVRAKDFDTLREQVYQLEGYYKETDQVVSVHFVRPPAGGPVIKVLEEAIKNVNTGDVRSPAGKRLILDIMK